MHFPLAPLALLALASISLAQTSDPDKDGDGLSDFHERHKYGTDPSKADSDGDGVPDGDWNERREYAYTVRSIVQVLPPVTSDVLSDDYQDARMLEENGDYVELEVVHYPLNTVAGTIRPNPDWREDVADMQEWLVSGPTSNWDAKMQAELVAALERDGIFVEELDDVQLVQQASRWLLQHARYVDGFTTFCSQLVGGVVRVHPELEQTAADGVVEKGLPVTEQWQRELFAKGMFENGTRGSCTSSAIYLNGCLRALGIPTRIVLAIPVIDASDERELQFVRERLRHRGVRRIIENGTEGLGDSWASHTFNEVFVGGRWRRLNYEKLGQDILDSRYFGLLTHVATFSDWTDGDMASSWGLRQAHGRFSADAFGGANPYSTITLSDRFGVHASIADDALLAAKEFTELTIDRAYWFHSDERPEGVDMRLSDPDTAGHVLVHVREGRAGEGAGQYRAFYERVGKEFLLSASQQPNVRLQATRGYWANPEAGIQEFYLRLEPGELERMVPGVAYRLEALNGSSDSRWVVSEGVSLTRSEEVPPAEPELAPKVVRIDRVVWSDSPKRPLGGLGDAGLVLLARMGPKEDFPAHKEFTREADRRFALEAQGHPTVVVSSGVGGYTNRTESYAMLRPLRGEWDELVEGVEYALRPLNTKKSHRWELVRPFRVER